jgi:hypothetical protein
MGAIKTRSPRLENEVPGLRLTGISGAAMKVPSAGLALLLAIAAPVFPINSGDVIPVT